jgi:hypothetical protein
MRRIYFFLLILMLVVVFICGCYHYSKSYFKPGITDEQRKSDAAECLRQAKIKIGRSPDETPVTLVTQPLSYYLRACMEEKGYTWMGAP